MTDDAEVRHDGPSLRQRVRDRLASGQLDLAPIGSGATDRRWSALAELARHDVSEARIAEAHVDAVQIHLEAGRATDPGLVWGVWASQAPNLRVRATPVQDGLRLSGRKGFCGGAGIVDAALVTVELDGATVLLQLDGGALEPDRIDTDRWFAHALSDTATATVNLDGIEVSDDAIVGAPGWYTDRPGFWHGAIGPAACWAGAAQGLVDHALHHPPSDPHGRAHLGALVARAWSFDAVLAEAGREIDAAQVADATAASTARRRALSVRHLIDVGCAEIQDRFARALGPRPLVGDADVIARDAALSLYRRQCHAERDLEVLGDLGIDL